MKSVKRAAVFFVVCVVAGSFMMVVRANQPCEGIFVDPNTFMGPGDPAFLSDPNNQVRLYENLRVGQKLNITLNACDPDGDPVGSIIPYMSSDDATYTVQGPQIVLQYHARGQAKRDIIAFVLVDAPVDPNVTPASRIGAIVIDVHKNRPPVWR
jgi:hypothetical protein